VSDSISLRCQAMLLMPESRRHWDRSINMRCTYSAKPDSAFCGVHKKLEAYITEIVWKEEQ
jgi:hypothetical protein